MLLFFDLVWGLCRFVKQQISLAPNNPSAWNYLRGVLDHTKTEYGRVLPFVKLYCVSAAAEAWAATGGDIVDVENPPPSEGAELPCVAAIEFLADIYEREKSRDGALKAIEVSFFVGRIWAPSACGGLWCMGRSTALLSALTQSIRMVR